MKETLLHWDFTLSLSLYSFSSVLNKRPLPVNIEIFEQNMVKF